MGESEPKVQGVLGTDAVVGEGYQETRAAGSDCDHAFD